MTTTLIRFYRAHGPRATRQFLANGTLPDGDYPRRAYWPAWGWGADQRAGRVESAKLFADALRATRELPTRARIIHLRVAHDVQTPLLDAKFGNDAVADALHPPGDTPTHLCEVHTALAARDRLRVNLHHLHISEHDPKLVAYAPTPEKLAVAKYTRLALGRYLNKEWADLLDAGTIKGMVEEWNAYTQPRTLKFIENDDPDGWVEVYEHGERFTSCMVRDREDPHINKDMPEDLHPVMVYAHEDNDLRLAYIGERHRVFARAIVREKQKRYVRIYGDDSMAAALQAAGYHSGGSLDGATLAKIKVRGSGNLYLIPYLDGDVDGAAVFRDHLVCCNGMREAARLGADEYLESSASGWGRPQDAEDEDTVTCEDCNNTVRTDDAVGTYHGTTVCESCCEHHYSYARVPGRGSHNAYVHNESVVEVGDEYYFADDGFLSDCGFVQVDGDWQSSDDVVWCTHGRSADEYIMADDAQLLDEEYYGCDKYAHVDDCTDTWLDEDCVVCAITGVTVHGADVVEVRKGDDFTTVLATEVVALKNRDRFAVRGNTVVLDTPGYTPLSEYLDDTQDMRLCSFSNSIGVKVPADLRFEMPAYEIDWREVIEWRLAA